MLAHAIHFVDVGAAAQQGAVDRLLVAQCQSRRRKRQQGRAAARDEADDEVVARESLDHAENARGCALARGVGDRVACLDDRDARQRSHAVAVAGDDEPRHRAVFGPMGFNGLRHGGRGFSGADDDRCVRRAAAADAGRCRIGGRPPRPPPQTSLAAGSAPASTRSPVQAPSFRRVRGPDQMAAAPSVPRAPAWHKNRIIVRLSGRI